MVQKKRSGTCVRIFAAGVPPKSPFLSSSKQLDKLTSAKSLPAGVERVGRFQDVIEMALLIGQSQVVPDKRTDFAALNLVIRSRLARWRGSVELLSSSLASPQTLE